MPRSMLKYFKDAGGDEHGGRLVWPGVNGVPFRGGAIPDLKQSEADDLPIATDFHSRRFELWKDEDKQLFDQINDRITAGWYFLRNRIDKWSEEHQYPIIWLEWIQCYAETPDRMRSYYGE